MNVQPMTMDGNPWMRPVQSPRPNAREAAAQLVSDALVRPALSLFHESSLRPTTGPFAPSTLEKRFAPLLEAQLADRVTKASNFNLIDAIVDRYDRRRP